MYVLRRLPEDYHVGMPEKEITDAVCILKRLPEQYHVGMPEKEIIDAVCILRRLPEEYHVKGKMFYICCADLE